MRLAAQEVAERLGISVQAVRQKCRRQDGSLIADLVKQGKNRTPTWVISGGSLLDPEPQPDPAAEEWERIREEMSGGSFSEPDAEPGPAFKISPEKLLSMIKGKMPNEMFRRNEFLIELWCQIAPEYLNIDLEKLGKWGFYGIPVGIGVSEAALARKKRMDQERASRES